MKWLLLAFVLAFLPGCVNIYSRCPGTDGHIVSTYQSTRLASDWALVVMFPQVLAPDGDRGLNAWNILTIPLGCICLVDVACEVVLDTAFWPIDACICE